VFVPEGGDRQMFYMACEQCKKKVMQVETGFHCENCMRTFASAVPTYNFSVRVSDCSGTIIVSCFGDIGDKILGMSA